MLNAEARVATDRASRYLVQLCRHAGHMRRRHADRMQTGHTEGHGPRAHHGDGAAPTVERTEWSDTHGVIKLAWGQCTLQATSAALTLRVEAADIEHLRRIQDGVARRLETFGWRERLKVEWQSSEAPPDKTGPDGIVPAPEGSSKGRLRRWIATGLMAVGVMVVAGHHLGLFGGVAGGQAWMDWAAMAIVALVLLKVVTVGVHVALGGYLIRGSTRSIAPRGTAGLSLQRLQGLAGVLFGMTGHHTQLPMLRRRSKALQDEPSTTPDTAPAPDGGGRSRGWAIGLIAAGMLIVAGHLGLFGASLAAVAWTGWAAAAVVAVVLLKVVTIGVHVALGGYVIRRHTRDTAPLGPVGPHEHRDDRRTHAAAEETWIDPGKRPRRGSMISQAVEWHDFSK